jgi:hypothetical protein
MARFDSVGRIVVVGNFDLGKNYLTCGENSAECRFGITLFARCSMSIGSKSILWSNLGRSIGLVRFGTTLAMYLEPRDRAADVEVCGTNGGYFMKTGTVLVTTLIVETKQQR